MTRWGCWAALPMALGRRRVKGSTWPCRQHSQPPFPASPLPPSRPALHLTAAPQVLLVASWSTLAPGASQFLSPAHSRAFGQHFLPPRQTCFHCSPPCRHTTAHPHASPNFAQQRTHLLSSHRHHTNPPCCHTADSLCPAPVATLPLCFILLCLLTFVGPRAVLVLPYPLCTAAACASFLFHWAYRAYPCCNPPHAPYTSWHRCQAGGGCSTAGSAAGRRQIGLISGTSMQPGSVVAHRQC